MVNRYHSINATIVTVLVHPWPHTKKQCLFYFYFYFYLNFLMMLLKWWSSMRMFSQIWRYSQYEIFIKKKSQLPFHVVASCDDFCQFLRKFLFFFIFFLAIFFFFPLSFEKGNFDGIRLFWKCFFAEWLKFATTKITDLKKAGCF